MHRVDGLDFAPGNLFREGNPGLGELATQVTAAIMNALQEEIAHVIEGESIALVKADNTQLQVAIGQMIKRIGGNRARQHFNAQN